MGHTHFSLPIAKRNQILGTDEVRLVDSQQNKGLKCFFLETKESISFIPMGTTHFSLPVVKRNQFLAINEVRSNGTQKNEQLKCFFPKTKSSISCIPMGTTHFSLPIMKKKIKPLLQTKFVPLIPDKVVFSRNQSINIVYPNGNYTFIYACCEKKLDSFHERSSFG